MRDNKKKKLKHLPIWIAITGLTFSQCYYTHLEHNAHQEIWNQIKDENQMIGQLIDFEEEIINFHKKVTELLQNYIERKQEEQNVKDIYTA